VGLLVFVLRLWVFCITLGFCITFLGVLYYIGFMDKSRTVSFRLSEVDYLKLVDICEWREGAGVVGRGGQSDVLRWVIGRVWDSLPRG